MKHHIISAKEARATQTALHNPEKTKERRDKQLSQELNRIHEEIQDAITRNDNGLFIYIHRQSDLVEPLKKALEELGYKINSTDLDLDPLNSFRISW